MDANTHKQVSKKEYINGINRSIAFYNDMIIMCKGLGSDTKTLSKILKRLETELKELK